MGSGASYVLMESGKPRIYTSHWGAQQIDRDFFWGPHRVIPWVRRMKPAAELLDQTWCEGAALVNLDDRRLLVWGGEDMLYDARLRQLWLELMEISWEGWEIAWAARGIFDIAGEMGVPQSAVRTREPEFGMAEVEALASNLGDPHAEHRATLLTLRVADGTLRDLQLQYYPEHYLGAGPGLIPLLQNWPTRPLPREEDDWHFWCIFIDIPGQQLFVHPWGGFGTYDPLFAPRLADRWPGWQVRCHTGGVPYHVWLTGRDPAPSQRPVGDHLQWLAQILLRETSFDPAAILKLLESEGNPIQVNPGFLDVRKPPTIRPKNRQQYFERIVARWTERRKAAVA